MIELIVVVGLISSVAISIYLALLYGGLITILAHHEARANQIVSQELEIIRNTAFASLTTPYNGAFLGSPTAATDLPAVSQNLVVSYYDPPTNSIKQAVATLNWTERGKTYSVSHTTLVVNQGLNQ